MSENSAASLKQRLIRKNCNCMQTPGRQFQAARVSDSSAVDSVNCLTTRSTRPLKLADLSDCSVMPRTATKLGTSSTEILTLWILILAESSAFISRAQGWKGES